MKNILWATLILATFFGGRASAQNPNPAGAPTPGAPTTATAAPGATPAPPAPVGRKKRIAIFDFDYATVQTVSAAAFGTNVDVGKGITDLLVKYLVQDGTYSVIERQALDKIMAEQNFSNSDRANPNSAAKIGKLLGVDAIIVGAVTQFGNDTKTTNVGGAGGGFGGFGVGGFSHKNTKAIVNIDARIVDIDTAEILGVAEGHGESSRSSTGLLGGGGHWGGWGGFRQQRLPADDPGRGRESLRGTDERGTHRRQHQASGADNYRIWAGRSGRWRANRFECGR
jgi:curli biogenesis system outer membrane secretion channel CsgG